MKNNKKYNYNTCKTEFLFESDAEKVVLKEAAKPKRPKIYKRIIFLTCIVCIFFISITLLLKQYEIEELAKINASIHQIESSNKLNEKTIPTNNNLSLDIDYNKKYEIIVNKYNPLNEEYIDYYNIVSVKNNLYKGIKLEKETYNHYIRLKENLTKRGYYITITSGFRTFEESKRIYNMYEFKKGKQYAEKYITPQGASEHNTGLAFDFIISKNKNSLKTNYKSEEYNYLNDTAYLYGFIFRYPKEKEYITGYQYEPWHLRYVGIELAKYLKKNNLTLEEYHM